MAANSPIDDLYERHIKELPPEQRAQLADLIRAGLHSQGPSAGDASAEPGKSWHVHAEDYVYELRREWDQHL
jgi:hypothetical protein